MDVDQQHSQVLVTSMVATHHSTIVLKIVQTILQYEHQHHASVVVQQQAHQHHPHPVHHQ